MAAHAQRFVNSLRTAFLLVGMAILVGSLGWMIFGTAGLLISAGATIAALLLAGRMPVAATLRAFRAQPLSADQAPHVFDIVRELARRARLPVPRLAIIPSAQPNAMALGSGDNTFIALTSGLLGRMNPRELAGILAHEMSHLQNRDLPVMMLARQAAGFARFLARFGIVLLILNIPLTAMGVLHVSWAAVLIMLVAPTVVTLLALALSRTREYDADLGAVRLTGDPAGLASALQKLDRASHSWFEHMVGAGSRTSWWMTHPATGDRVRRLSALTT